MNYWQEKKLKKEKAKTKRNKDLTYNGKKYRSLDEVRIARQLDDEAVLSEYEKEKFPYIVPESKHTYTPDFRLLHRNGHYVYLECKGVGERYGLHLACRKKMAHIKEQHPDTDIRFIFSNPNYFIKAGSKTTYAMWATKNGFKWADKCIPKEWLKEVVFK